MRKHLADPALLKNAIAALCDRWTRIRAATAAVVASLSESVADLGVTAELSVENLESRTLLSASWSTFAAAKPSGKAPQAIFKMLAPAEMVGTAITVDGTGTTVGDGSPASSNYVWNFGDGNGAYNTLAGFNASHVYNTPGTYTLSLTVTNDLGLRSTVSTSVKIAADTRRAIYVDSSIGNDNNSGNSPSSAFKTIYRADAVMGNNANTEILLKRGESFAMTGNSVSLAATNQLMSAYGTGADPVLSFTGNADYQNVLTTSVNSLGVTYENLSINTVAGNQPFGLEARGYDVAILNCTFNNVDYAVNANGEPTGLLVQNCSAPSKTGVYGYFVWGEGNDLSVIGNYAADSVNEHTLRATSYDGLLVAYNNFTNDDGKGCIECHNGTYVWVAHNTVSGGDIRVGPLTIASDPADSNTTFAVIDGNTFNNDSWMQVDPGSYHVSIRNNVIYKNSAQAIYIAGADTSGRQDSDIQVLNNTGVSDGQTGNFVKVGGVCQGIVLENNLLIAPELSPGAYGTAAVYVNQSSLSSFTAINGNVWQLPTSSYSYAAGGVMFIDPTSSSQTGYYTPAEWNALSGVGTDFFVATSTSQTAAPAATIAGGAATLDLNVPIPSSSSIAAKADQPVGGVYTDFYGNTRSSSGTWSAGATQYGAPQTGSPVESLNSGDASSSSSSGGSSSGGSTGGSGGGSTGGSGGGTTSSTTGSVSGNVTDEGTGQVGMTVYLDANNNSKLDAGELSTTTDIYGNYSFTGVKDGAYVVRQKLPTGIEQLTPTLDYGVHITVSAGDTVANFADLPSGSIGSAAAGGAGTVTGAVTDNGKGQAGVTVYLDANNNGLLDSYERTATTNSAGVYTFVDVKPAAYVVRQILPSGIGQLTPIPDYGYHIVVAAGKTVSGQNFTDSGVTSSTGSSSSLPSGWSSTDIGTVGKSGSATYSSSAQTYTVQGAGDDIYNSADGFHYTYTALNGNGTIMAEVSNLGAANAYAKAGVMIRNGTAANAAEVSMNLTPSKTAELDYRSTAGSGTADHSITGVSSPEWVKLVRTGSSFSGYVSSDGKTWKLVSTVTVAMGTAVDIGLDVTSKNTGSLETATFSDVAITA